MRRSQGDEQLMAYVLGELSASEVAEVEARLLVDEEAAVEVESMRAVAGMLEGAFAGEKLPGLGEPRRGRVLAGPEPMRMRWGWQVRAAAALLIGLAGVVVTKEILVRSGGERDSRAGIAEGTARPATDAPLREAVARDDRNVPFRFMGETSPVMLVSPAESVEGNGPVMLTLHTVMADAGEARLVGLAGLPRLVDDIEVQTPLREQYKTGAAPDGPGGEVRLISNVFRF